jgi:uncharacterized membrane protein
LIYGLLIIAVLLLTAGQIFQKLAVERTGSGDWNSDRYRLILRRPELYFALGSLGVGTAIWLVVLYQLDVSKAFPFISLSQVMIVVTARVFFGETVTLARWAGVCMIAIGIGMIAPT